MQEGTVEGWALEALAPMVGMADRRRLPEIAEGILERSRAGDADFYRVTRSRPPLGRGLVLTPQGAIPDVPRVRQVFHLARAIAKYYYAPFHAEEELPGYHVRVTRLGNRTLAFTRDGRWCPFATDRAGELVAEEIFAEKPDLVVCLAVTGTGVPYPEDVPPGAGELEAGVVDLLERGVREPWPPADRYAFQELHGLRAAPHRGPFTAAEGSKVAAWAREIDAAGGSGLVLKPAERHHRPLRYATPGSLLRPLGAGEGLTAGHDPYRRRLLEAACAAAELEPEGRGWEGVGKALLAPLQEAARAVAAGGRVEEERSVWLHRRQAAEALLERLRQDGDRTVEAVSLEEEGGGWRLRYRWAHPEASRALRERLSGTSFLD